MPTHIALPEGIKIPKHIAIIMDGNGRWAKERNLPRTEGHIQGQTALKNTLKAAVEFGVEMLTVYAFSTENWNRPKEEVDTLMTLFIQAMLSETPELIQQGVKMQFIGDTTRLPQAVLEKLNDTVEKTKTGTQITLNIAVSYSGRDELARAVTQLLENRREQGTSPIIPVTEEEIASYLDTANMPELDLMIRTGKEVRISNFLLWQAAYSELYFSSYYWPDFGREALLEAILEYSERERRYGKTSEQLVLLED